MSLNSYQLSKKLLNHSKMANLASRKEFLEQWEKLFSSMICPNSINLQTFFADLNRDMKLIILNGWVLKNKPMPFYSSDWQYVNNEYVRIQPKFEAVSWLIRIDKMAVHPQNKLALSQFVLWIAKKYYSIKP